MTIEKATSNDNEILTAITKKSKAYWGYSEEQIEIWSEQLTITPAYITTKNVFKLIVDNKIIGYYSYYNTEEKTVILDNLFVMPDAIGKGFGRILMADFLSRLQNTNTEKVTLDSEPNAENFYIKFGFTKIRQLETSIKDRYLPVMELHLNTK